jgi:hypothetical protein
VIGRAPTCDVVLDEPEVSRRHALLQLGMRGQLDIVPLPNARTLVNGTAIETTVAAVDGDVLAFPGGASIKLAHEADARSVDRDAAWLFSVGGRRIGLRPEQLSIGGGDDDVMIETWPPGAAQLTWREAEPWLEARVDGLTRNEAPIPRGNSVALGSGDRLLYGQRLIVVSSEKLDAFPTHREQAELIAIKLELLPTGGLLTVRTTRGEHRALLAERRFALASILLHPPSPYKAGDYIPDDVIFSAVWPRVEHVDRGDLNQLASRLRHDLKAAGLAQQLVERYVKGGATRFVVGSGVTISAP